MPATNERHGVATRARNTPYRFGAADEFAGCTSHDAQIARFLAGPDHGQGDALGHLRRRPHGQHQAPLLPSERLALVVPADGAAVANSGP
jgi:hypothetical protein